MLLKIDKNQPLKEDVDYRATLHHILDWVFIQGMEVQDLIKQTNDSAKIDAEKLGEIFDDMFGKFDSIMEERVYKKHISKDKKKKLK